MTTHPDPTDPERALIGWLSDTIGLSKAHEADLARRLVAMRTPPERIHVHNVTQTGEHFCETQCEPRKELAEARDLAALRLKELTRVANELVETQVSLRNWMGAALRAAQPAPAPSDAEISDWLERATECDMSVLPETHPGELFQLTAAKIDEALRLMRRATAAPIQWREAALRAFRRWDDSDNPSPEWARTFASCLDYEIQAPAAPSSGNDKLRRLREWLVLRADINERPDKVISSCYLTPPTILVEIDRLIAEPEPSEPPEAVKALERASAQARQERTR